MNGRRYVVRNGGVTILTAITIIQVKAGADASLKLISAKLTQGLTEVSLMEQVQILRKTVAATVTSATPILLDENGGAAKAIGGVAATGFTATVEGTDGDVIDDEGFNVLSGYFYKPLPEEMPVVKAGGIIAMKFQKAPSTQIWFAQMVFEEF